MVARTVKRGEETFDTEGVTVKIYERAKYARIDWDFFRLPEENDDFFRDSAQELSDAVKDIYLRVAKKQSEFYGNGLTGYMDWLHIDDARQAAGEVSDLFDRFALLRQQSLSQLGV